MNFCFQPLRDSHLALLHNWLNNPHVAERWGGAKSIEEVKSDYFSEDEDHVERYLVDLDEVAIGYIQSYKAIPCDGWWDGENVQDPGTVGIDFFIGKPAYLDKGIGTQMIKTFAQQLLKNPGVTKVISDPASDNQRSIRCLEKAGFQKVREIRTPDGRAVLMVLVRR